MEMVADGEVDEEVGGMVAMEVGEKKKLPQ